MDLKTILHYEKWDVSCQMQTLKQSVLDWFQSLLPALDRSVGCKSKFKEDEHAMWFQDTCNFFNGCCDVRNCTERKGANNCVKSSTFQRDVFSWKIDIFDIQFCSTLLLLGKPNHAYIWFKCI